MSLIHRSAYHISTFDVDANKRITPVALARYLQETSHQHSDRLGASAGQLLQGQFWVMAGLRMQMFRYPQWRDDITIETYPSAFEQLFTRRDFEIFDHHGQVIGVAAQRWMIISADRRRPMRIPDEIRALVPEFPKAPCALSFDEIPSYKPDTIAESTRIVYHSDIDMNQHANHTKYIEWALDALPDNIHGGYELDTLAVDFRAECVVHDSIHVGVYEQDRSTQVNPCFAHILKGQDKIAARVISSWRNVPTLL